MGEGVDFGGTAKIAQLHVSTILLPSMHCFSILEVHLKSMKVNADG